MTQSRHIVLGLKTANRIEPSETDLSTSQVTKTDTGTAEATEHRAMMAEKMQMIGIAIETKDWMIVTGVENGVTRLGARRQIRNIAVDEIKTTSITHLAHTVSEVVNIAAAIDHVRQ